MQNTKIRNMTGILVLVLLIVIYTIYSMNGGGGAEVTIGVDEEKIGIVMDSDEAVFISLEDVEDVALIENYSETDYPDYTEYISDASGDVLIITTKDGGYAANTSTDNATEKAYQEITEAIAEVQ